ncbi:iron ABC transporter permease [Methylosinus sp. Ce-a6]|uniref:ABC transporter permease n=1 Tax=Methylosinus sp. Ce-a6 TaxID=2172005 RepID=UPI00210F43DB|nr:ABC transporter permease subunit [Methylosinus sp. Ce-a6]
MEAYAALFASSQRLLPWFGNSLLLASLISFSATIIGAPLGVLLARTDLPWRGVFAVLFALPFFVPPYVIAAAWFSALDQSGSIGRLLPEGASEFLSSTFFGLSGCVVSLTTSFTPIVMLLTMAYISAVNPRLEQAGLLASRWPNVLWRITLPLIAPAIVFASVLVFLLTLGEVGVPTFLRYPVYPTEVLTQFAAFYDFSAATAAALPLLLVAAMVLTLEKSLQRTSSATIGASMTNAPNGAIALGRWRLPLLWVVSLWMFATVITPFAALLGQAASLDALAQAFARGGDSILRSVVFASVGATFLTLSGFFCGYLIHHKALAIWRSVDALTLFLFTLPGTVVGVGLISLWNHPSTNVIYATPAIVILGFLAQYALIPTRMTAAVLQRIPPSLENAAELAGAGWFTILGEIVAPIAKRGLIATWTICYIFCVRDLGIAMVVYPPGSDTLTVRIMTLMANGAPSLIAALCLILIIVTLAPLLAAVFWRAASRPFT